MINSNNLTSSDIIKDILSNEELQNTLNIANELTTEEMNEINSLYYHSSNAAISKLRNKATKKVYFKDYYSDGINFTEFIDNILTIKPNGEYSFYYYILDLIIKATEEIGQYLYYTEEESIQNYLYYLVFIKPYYGYTTEYLLKYSLDKINKVTILDDNYFNLREGELDNLYKIDIAFKYKSKIYAIQMKSYSFLGLNGNSYAKRNILNGVFKAYDDLGIDDIFICTHYHLFPLAYVCNAEEICSNEYKYNLNDRYNNFEELAEDIIYCIENEFYIDPPLKENRLRRI